MPDIIKKANKDKTINIKLAMEFLGSFTIAYCTQMTQIQNDASRVKFLDVNAVLCFSTFIMTLFCYKFSGAQFNPVISLSLLLLQKMSLNNMVKYTIVQFGGVLMASVLIYSQMSSQIWEITEQKSKIGIPYQDFPDISGLIAEFIGTFFIVWTYISITIDTINKKNVYIISSAMGFAYLLVGNTLGHISGGSFNPNRSIAPSLLLAEITKEQFLHFFGPVFGALCATLSYSWIFIDDEDDLKDELDKENEKDNYQLLSTGDQFNFNIIQ